MVTEEKYIETQLGKICFFKTGNGPNAIICFHGFGQDKSAFEQLFSSLAPTYTVYSIDLFFHGSSQISKQRPISTKDWQSTFIDFCRAESIETYSLLGFSLGGRFAINSFMAQPSQCTALHLLASDGIARSPWYEIATFPILGTGIFRLLTKSDTLIPSFLSLVEKIGWVDKKVIKFGRLMTETHEQRMQLFNAWVYFKPLWISRSRIIKTLNSSSTILHCYTGKYDTITPPYRFKKFLNNIKNKQDIILDTGHNQLITKTVDFLRHGKRQD
uniref:alpha/beta hydrolase n=1 Tax=Fulvivirga sp. TaxID=1931237 RepID=UPI00404B0B42